MLFNPSTVEIKSGEKFMPTIPEMLPSIDIGNTSN